MSRSSDSQVIVQPSAMQTFAKDYAAGAAVGQHAAGVFEEMQEQDLMSQMMKQVQEGGNDLNAIDPTLYSTPAGMKALGKTQSLFLSSQEGMKKSAELNRQLADRTLTETAAKTQLMEQAMNNPDEFAKLAVDMSQSLPLPYYFRQSETQPGMFETVYQSKDGDKPTSTVMSGQQVVNLFKNALSEKNRGGTQNVLAQHMLTNIMGNMENKQKPETWMWSQDGKMLVPQKQMHNGKFSSGYLYDGRYYDRDELAQMGVQPMTMDQLKTLSIIDNQKQRLNLASAREQRIAGGGGGGGGGGSEGRGSGKQPSPTTLKNYENKLTKDMLEDEGAYREKGQWVYPAKDAFDGPTPVPQDTIQRIRASAKAQAYEDHGMQTPNATTSGASNDPLGFRGGSQSGAPVDPLGIRSGGGQENTQKFFEGNGNRLFSR